MANLSYYSGSTCYTNSDYVRVGHNSSTIREDAVWSFSIGDSSMSSINTVQVNYSWNKGAAGEGWSGTYSYICKILDSNNSTVMGVVTLDLGGTNGSGSVAIGGMNLIPGATYFIHWNQNGTTYSTLKPFSKYSGQSIDILSYTSANSAPSLSGTINLDNPNNVSGNYISNVTPIVSLYWPAATDPQNNIDHYDLIYYRNGSYVSTTNVGNRTSWIDVTLSGITEGSTVQFFVYAVDAGGATSAWISSNIFTINYKPVFNGPISGGGTITPGNFTVSWPKGTDNGGYIGQFSGLPSYRVYIKDGLDNLLDTRFSNTNSITINSNTICGRGGTLKITVEAVDGWNTSTNNASTYIYVNDLPSFPSGSMAYITNPNRTIQNDSAILGWTAANNSLGTLNYQVLLRVASTSAELSSATYNLIGSSPITAYNHIFSTSIAQGYYFQYRITVSDGIEVGTNYIDSPVYQRGIPPNLPSINTQPVSIVENNFSFSWNSETTNSIGVGITQVGIEYSISNTSGSYTSWIAVSGSPFVRSSTPTTPQVYSNSLTNFSITRGQYIQFRVRVIDQYGIYSAWKYIAEIRYNRYPNNILSVVYPTTIVKPENENYTQTTFSIMGNGDPDAQEIFFSVELCMDISVIEENRIWKNISVLWPNNTSGWVSAGNTTPWTYSQGFFNFSSSHWGGLINTANYFSTNFNTNTIYNNCALRVSVKDSLGAINPTKFITNPFVIDYRENPSVVQWSETNSIIYNPANNKTGLINGGQPITLTWLPASDRNSFSTVPFPDIVTYDIYASLNNGTYNKVNLNSISNLTYEFIAPSVSINTSLTFKVIAVDSTNLKSDINSTLASETITICRYQLPTINLISAIRDSVETTSAELKIVIPDTGGSRISAFDSLSTIYSYWDSINNLTEISWGIQYSLKNNFPSTSETETVYGGFNSNNNYSVVNVPPYNYSLIDGINTDPISIIISNLLNEKGYYVRAFIFIDDNLDNIVYSSIIYIRDTFPSVSFRKNTMGINIGSPDSIPTSPAFIVVGKPEMIDGDNVLEIASNGICNNTFIGFRANSTSPETLTARFGVSTDGYLNSYYGENKLEISKSILWESSTGAFSFDGLSIDSGDTTFSIGALQGQIVDNTTDPLNPTIKYVNFTGKVNITSPYLTSSNPHYPATYVLIGPNIDQTTGTNEVILLSNYPTPTQTKDNIFVGSIAHPSTTLAVVDYSTYFLQSAISQTRDIFRAFRLINDGITLSFNGNNLMLNRSAGTLYSYGIGFVSTPKQPNSKDFPLTTGVTFQYRTSNGSAFSDTTSIDPNYYDNGGTRTACPNNSYSIQRIFLTRAGVLRIQYGQATYNKLSDAFTALQTENFIVLDSIKQQAILIGLLIVKQSTTNLNDGLNYLIKCSKIGEVNLSGGGSRATITLQNAFDNSTTTPQLVTSIAIPTLSLKNGNTVNTTNVLAIQNSSGTTTVGITGEGKITANNFIKSGGTSSQFLKADGSIDTNNYLTIANAASTYMKFAGGSANPFTAMPYVGSLPIVDSIWGINQYAIKFGNSFILQFGWGWINGDGGSTNISKTITYPVAMTSTLFISANKIGHHEAIDPVYLVQMNGQHTNKSTNGHIYARTNNTDNSMIIDLHDDPTGANVRYGYTWLVIGTY